MNAQAQRLGLAHTHFVNATGLPAPEHYASARDMAALAAALMRDFPQFFPLTR
jgi:D-alanyl-D-alanine carboxypeptidase (penicillin-binding protein 5/6)